MHTEFHVHLLSSKIDYTIVFENNSTGLYYLRIHFLTIEEKSIVDRKKLVEREKIINLRRQEEIKKYKRHTSVRNH